jgi:hypothetical protein
MLANVLIFMGAIAGVLGLTDLLISDAQKQSISNELTRAWLWLDERKSVSYTDRLRTRGMQIWLPLGITSIWFFQILLDRSGPNLPSLVLVSLIGLASGAGIWFTARAPTDRSAILRASICCLMSLAPLGAIFLVPEMDLGLAIFLVAAGLVTLFVLMPTVVAPLILVAVLTAALKVAELVVRRLLEYPKGPVLGLAVVLTSLGALFKGAG